MEKLDLTKILKEVSQMVFKGEVTFEGIIKIENFPIETDKCDLSADGRYCLNGEWILIPSSKDQKDDLRDFLPKDDKFIKKIKIIHQNE